jgi:hypothetical protein
MSAQFKAAMVKLSYNLHNCEINDSFHVHHGATGRNGYGANAFVPKRPDKSILEQFQKIIGLAQGVKRCEEDPVVLVRSLFHRRASVVYLTSLDAQEALCIPKEPRENLRYPPKVASGSWTSSRQ